MEKILIEKKGSNYYKALKLKYESQIQEALAILQTYFNDTVGIGEHSDILNEHDVWIDKLASANDKLKTLEEYFALKY